MAEIEVDRYYKRQAKDLVDLLFDKRFLADDLSREATEWLEDYIGFLLQSYCQTAAKAATLTKKLRETRE